MTFETTVMVTSCPADRSQWKRTFKIYPVGLTETLTVNLELQCECDCEKPEMEVGKQMIVLPLSEICYLPLILLCDNLVI